MTSPQTGLAHPAIVGLKPEKHEDVELRLGNAEGPQDTAGFVHEHAAGEHDGEECFVRDVGERLERPSSRSSVMMRLLEEP